MVRMGERFLFLPLVGPMTAIVEGIFKHGKIELLQVPGDLHEGRVRVILISQDASQSPGLLTFGKYQGDTSTLEDFRTAEYAGDEEFDNPHGQ